jgi:choline dehydrogenase-like flavoprotein
MVDGGLTLETERAEHIGSMAGKAPDEWSDEDLAVVREGTSASKSGIPMKRVYGSDFPFREADERLGLTLSNVGIKASLAQGGLSNVWGAAVLPYRDADMAGWPFAADRLAEHYRAVAELIGIAGVRDDLSTVFPLYTDRPTRLEPSQQASRVLMRLAQHRRALAEAGWIVGRSRLAIGGDQAARSCRYCGLCMYGCPYGAIYSAISTLDQLRTHPRFRYRAGVVVESIREGSADVVITGRDRQSGERVTIVAGRVYVAAGVIPSTRIVLRSLSAYDHPVTVLDSQYFLVPLVAAAPAREVRSERLHTLSQLFLELYDPAISPFGVHLQVYTYNDLMGQALRSAFGPLARVLGGIARGLEHRMLVIQGYLHSAHSGQIRVELKRAANGDVLHVDGVPRDESKHVIRRVLRKLIAHSRHLGAVPLIPMTKIADPGRGFHTGGSFPMRARPTALESDVLGRPTGWQRVHLVDSSILPSIPAATVTFPVMANAHRIASESASL